MAIIDERLVSLIFDNSKFNNNVDSSVKKMDELKQSLDFKGIEKGMNVLQDSVSNISSRFTTFGIAGMTAIQRLTNSAITFGTTIAKSVIDPIIEGGMRRAQNIEQAQFMFKGLMKSGYDWAKIEADLSYAVKGTAYGLDDAAKAASSLYASGVKLTAQNGRMGSSLRAISGVAAMTSSEYADIANIFTRVAGQGRLMAVDLNSLAARGLNVAADLAKSFGKTEAEVRKMVSEGKISFEEFAKVMDDLYGEHAKKANETYSGSMKNMFAALSRIGAKFASEYLTNMRDIFNAVTPQIDNISKALDPLIKLVNKGFKYATINLVKFINGFQFIGKYAAPVEKILAGISVEGKVTAKDLKKLGKEGVDAMGALSESMGLPEKTIKKMVKEGKLSLKDFNKAMERNRPKSFFEDAIGETMEVVKSSFTLIRSLAAAFSEVAKYVSPSADGMNWFYEAVAGITKPLNEFIVGLTSMVKSFTQNEIQVRRLALIIGGIGSIFSIAWSVVKQFGQALFDAFAGSGGSTVIQKIFEMAAKIGFWLINVDKALKQGNMFTDFFKNLKSVISEVVAVFGEISARVAPIFTAIGNFFKSIDLSGFGKQVEGVEEATSRLEKIFLTIQNVAYAAASVLWNIFGPAITAIGNVIREAVTNVSTFMNSLSFSELQGAAGIGFIAVLTGLISNLINTIINAKGAFMGNVGIGATLKIFMSDLGRSFAIMQASMKADVIVKYALAIGILALSLLVMSTIPADKLILAVGAMGILFKGIVSMIKILEGANFSMKLMWTLGAVASAIMTFSIALGILAIAVRILGSMSFEDLSKGLFGVAALIQGIFSIMEKVEKNGKEFAAGALGLIAIAIAMNILAGAVKLFGMMSIEELIKGVVTINAALLGIVSIMKLAEPQKMLAAGAGMIGIAIAATILAGAFKIFATMSPEEILKGLAAITIAMAGVVAASDKTEPQKVLAFAAAMLLVSHAVILLAGAFKIFATMSWDEILRATVAMVASVGILVGAMLLLSNPAVLAGAAALLVASYSMLMLAPALVLLGTMSWDAIGRGMAVLAASLAILTVGGILLIAALPGFLGLGVAVMLIGAGMTLAGSGVVLFAQGLAALALAFSLFIPVAQTGAAAIAGMLPMMATAFGEGLISLIDVIAENGVAITRGLVTILDAAIAAIMKEAPKLIDMGVMLISNLLEGLSVLIPQVIEFAVTVVSELLYGLEVLIPQLIGLATTIVISFLDAMEVLIPRVVTTGMKILNGILDGIAENIGDTVDKGTAVVTEFIDGVADNIPKVLDSGGNLVVKFLNGIADEITKRSEEIGRAGGRIATALIDGLVRGIGGGAQEVLNKIGSLANDAIGWAMRLLGIASPSKVFTKIGQFVTQGFVDGVTGGIPWSAPIKSEITEAFNVLKSELDTFVKNTDKDIKSAQSKLKKLKKKPKKNKKEISKLNAEIKKDKSDLYRAKKAQVTLAAQRKAEEAHLKKLNDEYATNNQLLEAAIDLLEERNSYAQSVRDTYSSLPDLMNSDSYVSALDEVTISYNNLIANINDAQDALYSIQDAMADTASSIKDQYSQMPSISQETTFAQFTRELEEQISATDKYRQDLQTLRSIGLDDRTYAALLQQGTAGQSFVNQLLAEGPEGLDKIEDLYAKLGATAEDLGKMVSQDFYGSGEAAAKAIVEGLESQEAAAKAAVDAASADYVTGFQNDIQKQIDANNKLGEDLAALRKLGLSDTAYAELVSKGTSAQPFITDLLSKGKSSVDQLNILISNLDASATALGNQAADEMYRVGEQTAQGLVDGLRKRQGEIEVEMTKIANSMVAAIKKQLGIKSPSRVFRELGGYASQGLAEGIQNKDILVRDAALGIGEEATNTLRKSLSEIAEIIFADVDSNPTIRPVLDLTDLRRDAAMVGSLIGPMTVGTSYSRASSIAVDDQEFRERLAAQMEEDSRLVAGDEFIFNQYNNSPKALSNGEIYRRTQNQISTAKGVVRRS